MRALLNEIGTKLNMNVLKTSLVRSTVFEDNQGCLALVNTPRMSPRNKYISLKYHWFRSQLGPLQGIVTKYVRSERQLADVFTKGLPPSKFVPLRQLLMGW